MAEPTLAGSTRVSIIPDTTSFGDRLRIELPSAIRQPAKLAGEVAGDQILDGIRRKLAAATPTVRVGVDLVTTVAEAKLAKLTKARTVQVTAELDDKAATTALTRLTRDRTVKVRAELDDTAARAGLGRLTDQRTVKVTAQLDDSAARTALGKLTADRTVKVTAQVDDTAAKAKLAGFGQTTADIVAKINDAAYKRVEKALDKLTADRFVQIRATLDTRVAANELRGLTQRQRVRLGVDVDTRVAANDLANLTRRRTARITARADTTGAATALAALTRDRVTNVRVRTIGLSALTGSLSSLGSASGSGAGLGRLSGGIGSLAAAAVLALPQVAALGSAVAQLGPLAAVAAPGVLTLATAFGAIKLGTAGVGDAIKAAFDPAPTEAKAAITATRQVETAQRSLANAQRGVADAERNLSQAQRTARQAQQELSAARRQAIRDLEDMNQRLRQGALDQKQAALDIEQAELDLAKTRSDPTATQLQIQQADLALERARAAAEEQSRQQKRLQADTAAANKAGVAGSDAVVQAQERIRSANEQVADQQRGLVDAHRAVADATRAVADAQQTAATQTTKLDDAISKLSPNARGFVNTLQAMAPAWRAMKLDVQDTLFAGLGSRLQAVGGRILPTVRAGFVGAAGELSTMAKNALTAVSNLEKTGQLKGAFDVIRNGLGNLVQVPGQIVTGLSQLTIAAGPAWDRITAGAGDAMDRVMGKLAQGLENGRLEEAINTALDVAVSFGGVLADLGGIIQNVFGAAAAGGGDFFAIIGAALAEIRRVTALPEVQASLTAIFSAVQAVAGLLAGALGDAIQAVLPVLAALAPSVTQVAKLLGPAVSDLFATLGEALLPVAEALGPVLVVAAQAIIALVKAVSPLLPVLGKLIGDLLPLVTPIFNMLVTVFNALAPVIAQIAAQLGPILTPIIEGLAAVISELAQQFAAQFLNLLQQLLPVLPMLIPAFIQLGQAIGQILLAVAPLLPQLLLLSTQFIVELLPALLPLLPPMIALSTLLTQLAVMVITGIVIPAMTKFIEHMTALREKLRPAVDAIKWVTEKIAQAFEWLYDFLLGHSVIPDIVNGAIRWFTDLRDGAIRIFNWIRDKVSGAWSGLWNNIKTTATDAWGSVRRGFDNFAEKLSGAFTTLKKGLGKIWDGLKELVKNPIKFWIDVVYNKGIVSVWNKTAAKIPGVPDLKPMAMPKGFARGGILPGQSSWRQGDDQLVPMRRGEGVYVSEAMRDPYERARLHAVNQAAMRGQSLRAFRGFAEGGIFDGITNAVGNVLNKGADVARGGLANLAEAAFKPVKSGITKTLGKNKSTWPGMIGQAPIGLINKAIDYIRGKDIVEGTGQWLRPVNAPYGTPFGKPGLMWSSGRHTGLDFPAKTGTSIRAVDSGIVRQAVDSGPYGKHIEINHGSGLSSLYAHMSAMLAKASDTVKRGQQIGRVGSTGNSTGPHLHLEARINGKTVDPMRYLEGGDDGGNGGAGVQRWRGIVTQALGQVGQSLSLVNTTLRRMNQESSGNPKAVNRNDINWINGTPSVGLMQVIEPTFNAYAGKYRKTGPKMYGVSIDPMANIYASMRYALARYGSLSRAYNRPGGYALGGIVGGGVQISTGFRRGSGYATGGIIRVGGKSIDTGPIAASVGANFLKALAGTASAIDKAMTQVATAIKNAFKGVKTTLDDKLVRQLTTQNKTLQTLAKARDTIASKIAQANAFAKETTANAGNFASLTGLPNSGLPFGADGILNGLQVRLGQLQAFSKNLEILGKRGLSKDLIGQIIQAGPDQGAPYAAALVKATDAQLKSINATQVQIGKAATAYGQGAADVMYDAGAMSGKGYLAGLKAQEKDIVKAMTDLAKKIQKTIKVELKIKSPSQILQGLGRFTGLGFVRGVRDTIPQAAAAAASMARVVRSTAAATVARTEASTVNNTSAERHLHYNALVRETASRRSILDALAQDDMLHRPVMSGAN
ncbi:peptidoglycan DD-metalloendopeptidase family protein [Streptomyces sp. CAI-121]|uniref:peptidoglycan DD-metalloendopeptidase family protein n=1 Tax=unclassified Streptomyces TaxID=2593676 RepID=UPI0015876EAB|nr:MULTISPECIES: peptidoglycan DD-metalloendopeptidase family protein [unclassified Streptomyces]NUV65644.1 peptidoglycan DD-metalloendopeptidase family protein [Streptomyces sp. CAI-121]NUW12381.1 peptidoglycan DD-metalloendopeptidase family protein [Streptomyces sp. CAI-68]